MLDFYTMIDTIQEHFSDIKIYGSSVHARCPFCGDSKISKMKKRFHFSYKNNNGIFHCFNCDVSGDFYTLYSMLTNISRQEAWRKFNSYNKKEILNKLKPVTESTSVKIKENFNWILQDCFFVDTVPTGHLDKRYVDVLNKFIKKRHITIPVYICYKGKYKDRIIIPVFDKDDIVFFQGRSIFKNPLIKYLNPVGDKKAIIYNKDQLSKETVYITEGILDAQSIKNGTCVMGKEISDEWLTLLIKEVSPEKICIVLDNDEAGKEAMSKIIKNSKYRKLLHYFVMPDEMGHIKDINSLQMEYPAMDINGFIDANTFPYWKICLKR